jgi:hypothetical protein
VPSDQSAFHTTLLSILLASLSIFSPFRPSPANLTSIVTSSTVFLQQARHHLPNLHCLRLHRPPTSTLPSSICSLFITSIKLIRRISPLLPSLSHLILVSRIFLPSHLPTVTSSHRRIFPLLYLPTVASSHRLLPSLQSPPLLASSLYLHTLQAPVICPTHFTSTRPLPLY